MQPGMPQMWHSASQGYANSMTSRRKRRQSERRLAKADRRNPSTIWTIVIVALVVIAVGLARTCR